MNFYEDEDGSCPVEEFLASLPDRHLGKVLQMLQLLEEWGPNLPFPYSSQVSGRLRELRARYGRSQYRVFYYGDVNRVFILLHAFRKRTARIPEREKRIALERMGRDIETREKRREGGER